MKLKNLFKGFLENCKVVGLGEHTIDQHEYQIRTFIGPILGELDISDIYPIHRDKLYEKSCIGTEERGRRTIITFRRILIYARKLGVRLNFDIENIEVPPYRRIKDAQAFTMEDIQAIRSYLSSERRISPHTCLKTLRNHRHAMIRTLALFEVLLHTGFRLSEALSVNIKDIDFANSEIRFIDGKSGKWETAYIFGAEKAIKEYLAIRKDKCLALFVSHKGTRLCIGTAQTYLKILRNRMGFKRGFGHQICRSTFVTMLIKNGADVKQAQILARHTSLQTTMNYYYAVEKEKLKPLQKRVMSLI